MDELLRGRNPVGENDLGFLIFKTQIPQFELAVLMAENTHIQGLKMIPQHPSGPLGYAKYQTHLNPDAIDVRPSHLRMNGRCIVKVELK